MSNLQDLLNEAIHSFLCHAPYVQPAQQVKWADAMASAFGVIESLENGTDPKVARAALVEDLHVMVYGTIDTIAASYLRFLDTAEAREADAVGAAGNKDMLARTLSKARSLATSNPCQAKRNLIAGINSIIEWANKTIAKDRPVSRMPFTEELVRT